MTPQAATLQVASTPATMVSRHLPALDGIRGLAILWVVPHNTMDVLNAPHNGPFHLLAMLVHPGWIGVQLFFALSGFLITGALLDTQGATNYYSGFYAKRILRIFPLYYGVLLTVLVLLPMVIAAPPQLDAAIHHQLWLWFFVVNYASVSVYGFAHFWSLAVEEQFYLFWPWIVNRFSARRLFSVCVWIAAGVFVFRSALAFSGVHGVALYDDTICRMDALSLGAAGAALIRVPSLATWLRARLRRIGLATLALFIAGIGFTHAYDTEGLACMTIGYSILAFSCAMLVTGAALLDSEKRSWFSTILRWQVLRACGKYSYAIYVLHALLHKLIGVPYLESRYGESIPPLVVFLYSLTILLTSFALAFCTYHLFEKHFLKMKSRFTMRQQQDASSVT